MQEIELKCQIPEGGREAVAQALSALAAQSGRLLGVTPLRAAYFDTPERALAAQRMALRVRQEGASWVQTLKAAGSTTLVRVEDNQPLPPPADPAAVDADLSRHPEGPAREALRRALGWDPEPDPQGQACGLVALYQTDIRRTHLSLDWPWDTSVTDAHAGRVELALDEGWIGAGTHRLTVCELEIESVGGDPQAVIEAMRWFVQQHGLWLDTRTKAHRGGLLANLAFGPAKGTARPPSAQGSSAGQPRSVEAADKAIPAQVADALATWMEVVSHLGAWDTVAAGWPAADADALAVRARWHALNPLLAQWHQTQGGLHAQTQALAQAQPISASNAQTDPEAWRQWARSPAPTLASFSLLTALLAAKAA
jgi:triphosphatase